MTQEQKAKAYDKAIKVIKDNLDALNEITETGANIVNIQSIQNCFYKAFPELKESDDERIRKECIYFLELQKSNHASTVEIEECIAWLEQQGKPVEINPTEFDLQLNRLLIKFEALTKEEIINSLNFYLNVVKNGYCSDNVEPTDYNSIDPHFGKPVDNVEPKFKIGDWVIDKQGIVHQVANVVENVTNHTYGYDIVGGGYFNDNAEGVRLWNIFDAKKGDVLVNGSNIFIFHFINDTRLMGYCHVNTDDGRFYDDIGKNECFCLIDAVVNPATKEQCDTLMKAMTDAGYKWDEEKKELKKIRQKPTWGEEDKHWMQKVIDFMNHPDLIKTTPTLAKDTINWLKSLNDRVQPQFKQEWSEEDRYVWKPSDEQMEALEHFVRSIGESGFASPYDDNTRLLYSLLEQLKKL